MFRRFVRSAAWAGDMKPEGTIIEITEEQYDAEKALGTHPKAKNIDGSPKWISPILNHTVSIDGKPDETPKAVEPMAMSDMNKITEAEAKRREAAAAKKAIEENAPKTEEKPRRGRPKGK